MENKENDITSSENEKKDEVVFAGNDIDTASKSENDISSASNNAEQDDNVVSFAYSGSKAPTVTNETKSQSEPNNANADDGIVFAEVEKHAPKHTAPKQKKKFPAIPVVAASVAVVCIVAVTGIILGVNANKNSVKTANDEVSHLTVPSGTSDSNGTTTLPTLKEESVEIKTVNTTNIVFGKGVTVEGIDLSGKTLSEAYNSMGDTLKKIRDDINIEVSCDGKTATLTEDDFKFDTDIADVLVQAYHYSRGELTAPSVKTENGNGTMNFKITSVINAASVKNAAAKVAKQFDIQPLNARVTKFDPDATEKFTYADGSNGYLVDQTVIQNKITDILAQQTKTGTFSVESVETPYTVTLAQIKANTKLIASHCTTAMNVWASNHNMELAISTASGTVVKPGETFSFNKMTGDTTNGSLGYVQSTAIVNGKYEQQYGGGICQASTTLYICALKANMEVVERHAHQYPSSYADRGLDATVDYGNLDMKFKNTGKYAVYIATYVYDYNGDGMDEIMVEMYGSPSSDYDEIVPVGWVTSAGSSSYSAKGAKVYFKNGKEVKREYLPEGSYDYHYDTYDSALSMIVSNPEFGPKDVEPTMKTPTIYSPNGCGSNAPVTYGQAAEVLAQANSAPKTGTSTQTSSASSSSSTTTASSH